MQTKTASTESIAAYRIGLSQIESRLNEAIALAREISEQIFRQEDLSVSEFEDGCADSVARIGVQLNQLVDELESFTSFE